MIWLGFPEEESGSSSSPAMEDAKMAIEEVTLANEMIDNCEVQLKENLGKLDVKLKKEEKEEWLGKLHLNNVNSDMTWGEIADEFYKVYSKEGLTGDSNPDVFCSECGKWIVSGRTECPEHGSGPGMVQEYDVSKMGTILAIIEGESNENIPFGRYGSNTIERVEEVVADGGCSASLSDFESELVKIIEGMNKLSQAIEEMRKGGEDAVNSSSDLKDFVKGIKSLKINTVENVVMDGKRWLVEHRIPGRSGTDSGVSSIIMQDMGRLPMRISFEGVLSGDNSPEERNPVTGPAIKDRKVLEKLELLKWFYKKRMPLFFACNLINHADIATKVMIEDLHFREEQLVNHQVEFKCTLVEYSDVHWVSPENREIQLKGIREEVEIWAQFQTLDIATSYRKIYGADPITKAITRIINGGTLK